MDKSTLEAFMKEEVIPIRVKFDDYLPCVLGVRRAAQIIMPAELPDASILGATIDDRFHDKMAGRRLPGESLSQFLKGKTGKFWRRNAMKEVQYRTEVLRDLYQDVVVKSHSYRIYMNWIEKLGLKYKELESRPTIREIYIFTDDSVAADLDELQDLRKDIRYEAMHNYDPSAPAYVRAFPEERNSAYLKKLGTILGFPRCCIERYVFDRSSGVLTPEVRASNQLQGLENPDECDPFAYYTKDFFPCEPDCPEAAKIGREVYEKLREIDPEVAERYKAHLSDNVSLVARYPEIIQEKVNELQKMAKREQEGDKGEVEG